MSPDYSNVGQNHNVWQTNCINIKHRSKSEQVQLQRISVWYVMTIVDHPAPSRVRWMMQASTGGVQRRMTYERSARSPASSRAHTHSRFENASHVLAFSAAWPPELHRANYNPLHLIDVRQKSFQEVMRKSLNVFNQNKWFAQCSAQHHPHHKMVQRRPLEL